MLQTAIGQILRDPLWQFIGAALGFIAIAVSLYVAWRQRQVKRLSYFAESNRLVSVDADIRDRVEIRFAGRLVQDVSLVEIGVKNSGNQPIRKEDFEDRLYINVGKDAAVLTAEVASATPEDLRPRLRVPKDVEPDRSTVEVLPLLLNPGDSFVLTCLVSQAGDVTASGRISGVSQLKRETREPVRKPPAAERDKALMVLFGAFTAIAVSNVVPDLVLLPIIGVLVFANVVHQWLRRE